LNIYWILKKYLGVAPPPVDAEDLKNLVNEGVRAVVSLLNDADLSPLWSSKEEVHESLMREGIQVIDYPLLSGRAPPPSKALELIKWIDTRIREGKPVVILCRRGWGRGGALVASYLVYKGKSPDEALRFVEEAAASRGLEGIDSEDQRMLPYKLAQTIESREKHESGNNIRLQR